MGRKCPPRGAAAGGCLDWVSQMRDLRNSNDDSHSPVRWPVCAHEHPVVPPQVSHFMQVPLRTSVKLPHSGQASPS